MESRIKREARETVLDLIRIGIKVNLTAKELTRLGIEIQVPTITAEQIADTRSKSGVSQEVFARLLGVTKSIVSQWERGERTPGGAAAVLLETMRRDPTLLSYRFAGSGTERKAAPGTARVAKAKTARKTARSKTLKAAGQPA